jgi:ribonuclease HI
MPDPRSTATKALPDATPPDHYLIAHSDGGARGNPGPAGYGVVIQDEAGRKVAQLSQYLGHQTNNFAEYQGLIAALEYALQHGPRALKLISDSELLVRQIKGIYKVKNPTLQDLHGRARELIAQLEWFSIGHALREQNQDADRLANAAMNKGMNKGMDRGMDKGTDKGTGRGMVASRVSVADSSAQALASQNLVHQELPGVIRNGVVELTNGKLPEGTRVQVRVKK